MIYRIAIYTMEDGKRKFDHYATDDEMIELRVNQNGKVELLDYDHIDTEENVIEPIFTWIDVSDTHEVEPGFVFGETKYYQNDILKIWLYKATLYDDEPLLNEFYYVVIKYDQDYDCLVIEDSNLEFDQSLANYALDWYAEEGFEGYEKVGNINENPELLGDKDELIRKTIPPQTAL